MFQDRRLEKTRPEGCMSGKRQRLEHPGSLTRPDSFLSRTRARAPRLKAGPAGGLPATSPIRSPAPSSRAGPRAGRRRVCLWPALAALPAAKKRRCTIQWNALICRNVSGLSGRLWLCLLETIHVVSDRAHGRLSVAGKVRHCQLPGASEQVKLCAPEAVRDEPDHGGEELGRFR